MRQGEPYGQYVSVTVLVCMSEMLCECEWSQEEDRCQRHSWLAPTDSSLRLHCWWDIHGRAGLISGDASRATNKDIVVGCIGNGKNSC
jgi:hypothetical protein